MGERPDFRRRITRLEGEAGGLRERAFTATGCGRRSFREDRDGGMGGAFPAGMFGVWRSAAGSSHARRMPGGGY